MRRTVKPLRLIAFVVVLGQIACTVQVNADDPSVLGSTELKRLRERCEAVLTAEFGKTLPKGMFDRDNLQQQEMFFNLQHSPFRLTEATLLRYLDDLYPDVRLTACQIIFEKSQIRHKREMLRAIENLKHLDDIEQSRLAVVRLELEQTGAIEEVLDWAKLGSANKRFEWFCPMHPDVTAKEKIHCPICGMELTSKAIRLKRGDAELIALAALADRGDRRVPAIASQILGSDVWPSTKMHAAIQWARVDPDDGLHHLRVFLADERLRQPALAEMAMHLPARFVDDFEAVLQDGKRPIADQLFAAEGLVRSGRHQHLLLIRNLVDVGKESDRQKDVRIAAILMLGDLGSKDDLVVLQAHLKSRLELPAAQAILAIMDRLGL